VPRFYAPRPTNDRGAAQLQPGQDGASGPIDSGHVAEVEPEVERLARECLPAGMFQPAHVIGRQPAGENDPRVAAPARGSDARHGHRRSKSPALFFGRILFVLIAVSRSTTQPPVVLTIFRQNPGHRRQAGSCAKARGL
jgi:hypothetical protein